MAASGSHGMTSMAQAHPPSLPGPFHAIALGGGAAADAAVGEVIDRDVRTSLTIRRVNNASSKPVQ